MLAKTQNSNSYLRFIWLSVWQLTASTIETERARIWVSKFERTTSRYSGWLRTRRANSVKERERERVDDAGYWVHRIPRVVVDFLFRFLGQRDGCGCVAAVINWCRTQHPHTTEMTQTEKTCSPAGSFGSSHTFLHDHHSPFFFIWSVSLFIVLFFYYRVPQANVFAHYT